MEYKYKPFDDSTDLTTTPVAFIFNRNSSNQQCQLIDYDTCSTLGHLIVPFWPLFDDNGNQPYHGVVYFFALLYVLFGGFIASSRLMIAGEVILSKKHFISFSTPHGGVRSLEAPLWNDSIARLFIGTLSWASLDIFLPIVEVFRSGFTGDQLGPAFIVGHSCFQLYFGIAICLFGCKTSISRKSVKDSRFFITTSVLGIFAYLWVFLLLDQVTPGFINIWEALLTLAIYPLVLILTFLVEKHIPDRFLELIVDRKISMHGSEHGFDNTRRKSIREQHYANYHRQTGLYMLRARVAQLLRKYTEMLPGRKPEEIEQLVSWEIDLHGPKSIAHCQ